MPKKTSPHHWAIFLSALILVVPFQRSYADYDSFTVNVPNGQGGYTAIAIRQSGTGYTGPQGEYYSNFPSVAQLQTLYRLGTPVPQPTITYVQPEPEVQAEVPVQIAYQAPLQDYEDVNDGYNYPPVIEPSITEENSQIKFFEFKKKKKPQQAPTNNQTSVKSTTSSTQNKTSPQKKDDTGHKGDPDQKKKPDTP